MKLLRKSLVLMFLFQVCFTNLIINKSFAEPLETTEISTAYLYNIYPVVNGKHYVNVVVSGIGYITSETDSGILYQWYKNDMDSNENGTLIVGANKRYYIPQSDDIGSYLYCTVSGDGISCSGEFTTRPTTFPVSETLQIGGAIIANLNDFPRVGYELQGYLFHHGSTDFNKYLELNGLPFDIGLSGDEIASYQWYRNKNESNTGGTAITGATSYKYTPSIDDFGYYLYFTAIGKGNYTGSITSNTTRYSVSMENDLGGGSGGVTGAPKPPTNPLKIEGVPVKHATLTADTSIHSKVQWYRNDVQENFGGDPILGATFYKYNITVEDVGKYLYVTIPNARDIEGNPIVSNATEIITDSEAQITNISINDNGYLGAKRHYKLSVISTTPSNITGTVQWYRNDIQNNSGGERILGATYESYTPTSFDVGKYLYCVYMPVYPFTGEPVTSEVTDMVENVAMVSFDPNGGHYAPQNVDVNTGDTYWFDIATALRDGYTFKGWATAKDVQISDITNETIIEEDITVYAVWEKINSSSGGGTTTHSVKFETNSGNSINSQNVVRNGKATKPADPVKNGNSFAGWYSDRALTQLYDFNSSVTGSLTLYAKWTNAVDKSKVEWKEGADKSRYIKGYVDGTFKPDEAIARYEMLEALSNLLNFSIDGKHTLTDVHLDYDELVSLFTSAGILGGYEDNTFKGENGLTRAEFVKIMAIILNLEISAEATNTFSDISTHWAKDYINAFTKLDYLKGYEDGTFKPDNKITRAEFVVIVNRIIAIKTEINDDVFTDLSNHWALNDILSAYIK